jgi:hypothetical protein
MVWHRVRRLVLIGTLTLAWMVARPTPSLACSCVAGPVETDVVFLGRVILVVDGAWVEERLRAWNSNGGSTIALLKVEQMRQGPPRPFYTVVGGTGGSDCSVPFERGVGYLIHGLHQRFGPLETNVCLGSHSLEDLPVEIAI